MSLIPIWTPADALDAATAFHAELANAERGRPERTSWLFTKSRERRARRMDGLAVLLLIAVMALLGAALFFSAPQARADGFIDSAEMDYSTRWADSICAAIDLDPSEETVMRIAMIIMDEGYEPDSAADIVNYSVGEWCPRNGPLLDKIGNAHRAQSGAIA